MDKWYANMRARVGGKEYWVLEIEGKRATRKQAEAAAAILNERLSPTTNPTPTEPTP
jgi:hypothetical protein